jgi:hypothetical protein
VSSCLCNTPRSRGAREHEQLLAALAARQQSLRVELRRARREQRAERARARDGVDQVAAQRLHADAVEPRVEPRRQDRARGDVDRGHGAGARPRCLPVARGDTTEALLAALRDPPHRLAPIALPAGADPLADDDLQLALYLCLLEGRWTRALLGAWERGESSLRRPLPLAPAAS